MAARKVAKQLFGLTESQMASVYSMPMSDAIMMANQMIEGNVPTQLALDTISSLLVNYDRGGAQLARAFNARKGLFKYDMLIADIKRQGAKGMTSKEAEEADKTDRRLEIIIRTNPDARVPVQAVIDGDFIELEE